MCDKAIVLNSGGCDSTTCVGLAVQRFGKENVTTVSINYGQRHRKELDCATQVAERYGLTHRELDFTGTHIMDGSDCPLLAKNDDTIKHESYADQIAEDGTGMVPTYVPFRNGLFLSAVAGVAMAVYPKQRVHLYYGAHADDAAGDAYADCSPQFAEAIGNAINIGTYGLVTLEAPLIHLNKAGVVKLGLSLNVPYELTWSCYEGGEKQCGTCGTCIDRKAAFAANGVVDPVPYEA